MKYSDLITGPAITREIIFEAIKIYADTKDVLLRVNSYHDYYVPIKGDYRKPIKEEKASVLKQDRLVLCIYLSFLKIDSVVKEKLKNIGLTYERVAKHLNIENMERKELTDVDCGKIYNRIFARTLNLITIGEGNTFELTPADDNFFKYVHDCIYEYNVVESRIVENLLLEMDLYDNYIDSFTAELDVKEPYLTEKGPKEVDDICKTLKQLCCEENLNNPEIDTIGMFLRILKTAMYNENSKENEPKQETLTSNIVDFKQMQKRKGRI